MTQKLSIVEQIDDFIRKTTPNEKWFRYFEALTTKYAHLWRIREQEREKLEHFQRKCRDLEEDNSKKSNHIARLKAALETETQEHVTTKAQLKKLMGQLRSAKDYMLGLDAQDEKTTDLINTICASPNVFRMASATTLGNKSGSLLDDYEENSLSTEGSLTTENEEFQSFRNPKSIHLEQASSNSESSDTSSSGPFRRSMRKRRSNEDELIISKKVKGGEVAASLTVSVDENRRMVSAEARINSKNVNRRRSKSVDARANDRKMASAPSEDDLFRTPSKVCGSPLYRSTSASKLTNKQHNFILKMVMVFENCAKCKRRFKFYREALRCIECNVAVHQECREGAPLPCIPSMMRTPVKGKHKLSEYCASVGPRVPPLLINCFHELEKSHRVKEVGLYRMSGQRTEVQAVARKLQKQVNHDLSSYDTHTITGVVKDFLLHSMSEPLIPSSVYNRFAKLSEPDNVNSDVQIRQEIEGLPQCNKDTLSFVMLHIGIVKEVDENKMDKECLTRVFAPSIVGYSLQAQMNPALSNQEITQRIMTRLMDIDPTFWDNIIQRAQRKATLLPRDRTAHSSKTLNFASPKIN